MSLIPENTAGINAIVVKPGSGLTVSTVANVDTITTDNILAGTGIALTRNTAPGINTLTINSSALGSGLVAAEPQSGVPPPPLPIVDATGSGISIYQSGTTAITASIVGAYVAGQGISLTNQGLPGSGNPHVLINNTMDITSQPASGISIIQSGSGFDADVALNVTAGSGIAITPGSGTAKQIANTMVVSGSGSGISVIQPSAGASVSIQNTGVTSVAISGAGLSTSSATGAITLQNTGVTSLATAPGTALSVSGSGALTIANTMALTAGNGITVTQSAPGQSATIATNISAGTGISVSGTTNRVVQNTMTLTAGPGISITQSSPGANATISSIAATAPQYYWLQQADPSTYGFGTISNGGQIYITPGPNNALENILNAATVSSTGSFLIQFTLNLSASPALPPGGPISVGIFRGATPIPGVINSSTIYPSPYQSGGSYSIYAVVPYSGFAATSPQFRISIDNNYGASIQAIITSPVVVEYVPGGIATA